jgi:hypothetical protein
LSPPLSDSFSKIVNTLDLSLKLNPPSPPNPRIRVRVKVRVRVRVRPVSLAKPPISSEL